MPPTRRQPKAPSGLQSSDLYPTALYFPNEALSAFRPPVTTACYGWQSWELRRPPWRSSPSKQSSGRSADSNCVRWCRLRTAPSTKWSSAGNFRGASRSRRAASSGTWRKSKRGWLRAEQPPLIAPSLLTSGYGDRARFESRVWFKQRHRRRDEYRDALFPSDPGVDDVRPLLHHVATLNFVLRLVIDAA